MKNHSARTRQLLDRGRIDTGNYDLVSVVSHSGRTADGGHYVSWALAERADGKKVKEDSWVLFDDDKAAAPSFSRESKGIPEVCTFRSAGIPIDLVELAESCVSVALSRHDITKSRWTSLPNIRTTLEAP